MAALDVNGFFGWDWTDGTFMRGRFHRAFLSRVVPKLNPWPLPRSLVIMDNAKIHAYPELEQAIHQCGAHLLFLPPYCPQLNPIENCFGLLKAWIQKHANLVFPFYPDLVLNLAMRKCTKPEPRVCAKTFGHCGYLAICLRREALDELIQISRTNSSELEEIN